MRSRMPPDNATQQRSLLNNPSKLLQTLARLRQQNTVLPFKFAQQLWFADGRHVLYWPARETLIVSDLHFGKGQSLNRFGNFIPTLDTASTLNLLAKVIEEYQPRHLIALGDSFHDKFVEQGMTVDDTEQLIRLCKSVPVWTWILGNHDHDMSQSWPGDYRTHVESQGVNFVHEPEPDLAFQIV